MDREQAKHICMELTADGARVTNLSLSGNRLVLTIEAQLSDSQLKASDQAARQAAAGSGQPRPGESQVRSDTEFLDRERAANRAAGGSEALPPAGPGQKPSVAFQPGQSYPIGSDTIRRENVGDAVSVNLADFQKGMDDTDEIHHGGFNPNDVMASHADTQPIVFEHNVTHHGAPAAPPLEPVRELTDTWDVTHDATTTDGVFQQHAETIRQQQAAAAHAAAPAPVKAPEPPAPTAQAPTPPTAHPAPAPVAPATPPPAPAPMVPPPPAISLDADPFPAQPSVTPLEAAPGFPEQPQPGPASAPRFGGDITLGDDPLPAAWGAGPLPTPFTDEPKPLTETWDGSEITLSDMPSFNDNQPAISEESAAFGGARHGEPQPTLSFGGPAEPAPTTPSWSDPIGTPAPAPLGLTPGEPATPPADAAAGPGLGFDFDLAAPAPGPVPPPAASSPAAPAPAPDMGLGIGFDFAPPPTGQAGPTAGPAVSLGLEPAPAPLSAEPTADTAPAPSIPPLALSDDHIKPGSEDKTVVGLSPFARDADKLHIPSPTPHVQPEPAAAAGPDAKPAIAPAPEPLPSPAPVPETAKDPTAGGDKTEPGGTTVLIRYTCPKCKTQGMQAVDKVGTVVNCSNCGKAMRLVMKK